MTMNLVNLSKNIEIEFKDKEARTYWRRWKHGFSNSKLVQLTTAWIKCMQYLMKDQQKLTREIISEAFPWLFRVMKRVMLFLVLQKILLVVVGNMVMTLKG